MPAHVELDTVTTPAPNSPDGFAAWVQPHVGLLMTLAAHEVASRDVDDVVQEALVRAWQRRSTFDPRRGTARAWLIAVLLDRTRRHRVRDRSPVPTEVGDAAAVAPSVERIDVEAAVRALPRRQREVITLHYLTDLPVTEVASVLGISEGSVKSSLHDARVALRPLLEDS